MAAIDSTARADTISAGKKQYGSMKKRWFFNSLSFSAAIVLFSVLFASMGTAQYFYSSMRTDLTNRALSAAKFMNLFLSHNYDEFYYNASVLAAEFSDKDKLELQFVDSTGRVMFSSSGLSAGFIPSTGDVEASLAGNSGCSLWSGVSPDTGERVMSASAPLYYYGGQVIGAVRFTTSLAKADRQIIFIALISLSIGAGIFLMIFLSNYYFIKSIVNPIIKLNDLAREIAAGNYGVHIEHELDDELGELYDSINYMSDAINKAEKMKNDIISSVSHELRTPLTAIDGWSETLLTNGSENPEVSAQGLAIIHKEAHRLSQMVEELLDFARIESGKFTLHPETFDLRGEFSDAAFVYTEMFKQDGLVIKYDESDTPVMVNGDRNRLKQVFLNILDNAAKYGSSGRFIELSITAADGYALAKVRDFGTGIPAEDLPYIKEKFYRGNIGTQNKRGTGIGLSVCDEIVRMHNGILDIESRLSVGTTVTIKIPLAPQPEQSDSPSGGADSDKK